MEINLSEFDLSEKEERILRAAIEVFSEKSYSAATTSEIAKKAKVAEGTVFNYFKTKKEILRRIVACMAKFISMKFLEDEEIKKDGLTCDEMIKAFIRPKVIFVEEHFPIIRIVVTEALYQKDIREMMVQHVLPKILLVFEKLASQMKEKCPGGDYGDMYSLIRIVGFQVYALAIQRSVFREMGRDFNFEAELDKTVRLILHGILSEGE